MKKNNGIALIQVLLITAIITVFALYLTQTSREQVQIAMWSQNKTQAYVNTHSAYSNVLFKLFTKQKVKVDNAPEQNAIESRWNFHNTPFNVLSSQVKIQDQAGKLSIHFIFKSLLVNLLTTNGVLPERAEVIWARLLDWQDADNIPHPAGYESSSNISPVRNGKIAEITEIEKILHLTEKEKQLLYKNSTMFFVGDINPLTATKELLASITSIDIAEAVVKLRSEGQLNLNKFLEISNIKLDDNYRFSPSNRLAIEIESKVGDAAYKRELVIAISPYAKKDVTPYNVLLDRN